MNSDWGNPLPDEEDDLSVPAPEQQGDRPRDGWLARQARKLEQQVPHVPTEYVGVPRPKAEEQQEAQREAERRYPSDAAYRGYLSGADIADRLRVEFVAGWHAGRAPLEERVRELQTTTYRCEQMCEAAQYGGSCRCSHLSNELPALEEERDRLRGLYDEACTAMDVLAQHSVPRARAEAAEAQAVKLREALDGLAGVFIEFVELGISRRADEAYDNAKQVLAETVQEGGETQ